MTKWTTKPAPVDVIAELRAASRLYNSKTFAVAANEIERLRAMADRFKSAAPDEYAGFLADYVLARRDASA
jgi:hypothetical protein